MQILRVFNNNVVLARDGDTEVILTGRGLGYQAKPGSQVDRSKVVRRFEPADGRDVDNFGALISAIPPEHVALADEALAIARETLAVPLGSSTVIALADHLSFAIKRAHQGLAFEYPLEAEVAHLYPQEYAVARRITAYINDRVAEPIPAEEAVAIALHLVNAGFAAGDLSYTYRMTGVFAQLFDVLETSYGRAFDRHGVNAARFITHLRYFFVRAHAGAQLVEGGSQLGRAIVAAYPAAYACALKLRAVLELRLEQPVTDDELAYLTLHVARLSTDDRSPT